MLHGFSCLPREPRIMLWSRATAHRSVLTQFVLLVAQLVCANQGRPCVLENNEIGRVLRDTWKNLTLWRAQPCTTVEALQP